MTERDEAAEVGTGAERVKVTDRRRLAREDGDAAAAEAAAASPQPDAGDEIATALLRAEEYRDHLQRLQAEFDNFRKRAAKEQSRSVELAARPLMERMLEVLDDFEMALSAIPADQPASDGFHRGMELLYAKFVEALRAEGLDRIEAAGQPFDPNEHEALMQTGDGDGEPIVAEVFRSGYRLRGQVLRPASVRVQRD